MARRESGLDISKIPFWQFTGHAPPHMTDEDIWKSWRRLRKYHIPYVAGGQIDQPSGWWEAMELCDALYNTLLEQAYDEKKKLKPPSSNVRVGQGTERLNRNA